MVDEEEIYDYICPISYELFRDPVKAKDGFIYEWKCIENWFQQEKRTKNGIITSPCTREIIDDETLVDCVEKRHALDSFLVNKWSHQLKNYRNESSIYELNKVFKILDPLQYMLTTLNKDWKVPQIVLLGAQSDGKSSLLERLVYQNIFPRDANRCTTVPVHIQLRNNPDRAYPPVLEVKNIKTGKIETESQIIPSENGYLDVLTEMEAIQKRESRTGDRRFFSEKSIIILRIENPIVPSIDLIDMPGIKRKKQISFFNIYY